MSSIYDELHRLIDEGGRAVVLTVLGGITLLQRSWSAVQDAR